MTASIAQLFFDACQQFDKKDAVLVKTDGTYKPISHRFWRQRVNHFARGLISLGVQIDEKVAILAETRFEWTIADLGIVCAGGVNVPIYPTSSVDDIAYILDNSDAVGVVASSAEQIDKLLSIKDQLPKLRFIIVMDKLDDPPSGVEQMTDIEYHGSQEDNDHVFEARYKARGKDDLLTLIYTSGTTGRPKGVMLSHGNLIANVRGCEPYMAFDEHDIHLSHLPLSHVLERMGGYYTMVFRGVTIAYAEDIKTVSENIMEVQPTILVSVPRLFEKIYAKIMTGVQDGGFIKRKLFGWAMNTGRKAVPYFSKGERPEGWLGKKWDLADKVVYSKVKEKTGGRLRFLISGGAPLSKEVAEFFMGMNMIICEGYGLTETSPVLTINHADWCKPGTVGPPIEGVEIKIADDGEILARGDNVMRGYYKNPEATAEVIVDGWFQTGDIGVIDSDGFLRITDRKKDIIVTSGGKNIAPQPLENQLKLSTMIEQAVVIGDKRNFISALVSPPWETVATWATAKGWPTDPLTLANHQPLIDLIQKEIDHYQKEFAHYEMVKKFRILPALLSVESGELTPSMKVKRRIVNERYKPLIDEMYDDTAQVPSEPA